MRVERQTYATYIGIDIHKYESVHGLIEEFGGRVKQFSQDIRDPDIWYIFFEMPKTQKIEFDNAMDELIGPLK